MIKFEEVRSLQVEAATDLSDFVYGEIYTDDAPKIISAAAQLSGVEPPKVGTSEYDDLVERVMSIAEDEREELKRLGDES